MSFYVYVFLTTDCNSQARLDYIKLLKEYCAKSEGTTRQRCLIDDPVESPLDSIFTWFLRSVMIRRRLDDGCLETLNLLSQVRFNIISWAYKCTSIKCILKEIEK